MSDNTPATYTFGYVLESMHFKRRFRRKGWGGEGRAFIFLVPGSTFEVNREPLLGILGSGHPVNYHAHIDIMTEMGYVSVWTPTQADMLTNDWVEVWPSS